MDEVKQDERLAMLLDGQQLQGEAAAKLLAARSSLKAETWVKCRMRNCATCAVPKSR